MPPHRMLSRQVPAGWCLWSVAEVCGPAVCRPVLPLLVPSAWDMRRPRAWVVRRAPARPRGPSRRLDAWD